MVQKNDIITDGTVKFQVKKFSSGDGNPVGTIIAYSANNLPDNYLLCDGSAISRTDYHDLFSVIGTTWGSGDGSTTFNIPNAVNRFPEGSSTAGGYIEAGLPNITGTISIDSNLYSVYDSGNEGWKEFSGISIVSGDINYGSIDITGTASLNYTSKSSTVQPESFRIRYLIKYI